MWSYMKIGPVVEMLFKEKCYGRTHDRRWTKTNYDRSPWAFGSGELKLYFSAQFQYLTFQANPRGQGCVLSQCFGLHVGLHFFHFNLICNITSFRKENIWPFDPTPEVESVSKDRIVAFMVLCAQFPLIWYATRLLQKKTSKLREFMSPPFNVCLLIYELPWNKYTKQKKNLFENFILNTFISW